MKRVLMLCSVPLAVLFAAPAAADPSPAEADYLSYLTSQRVSGDADTLLRAGYDACSGLQQGTVAPMMALKVFEDAQTSGAGLSQANAAAVVGGAASFLCPGH